MKNARPKIDPHLLAQLDRVAAGEEPVEAVFMLRPAARAQVAAVPGMTEKLTNEVLNRVREKTDTSEQRLNIFHNLGMFVISAPARFVRELLSQPEIASAIANQQPESAAIPLPKAKPSKKTEARGRPASASKKSKKARARPAGGSRSGGSKTGG
ncbi:MAG TPA: hypothetical protein VFX96_01660 [Pyrinomonadaceae bacterium]|nr:hypothetical protein [Pyrinomonadaceae bacterium]